MKEGAVGKNIFTHGKSSDKGPTNALIPYDAALSKAGNNCNAAKIQNYNSTNIKSLGDSQTEQIRLANKIKNAFDKMSLRGESEIDSDSLMKEAKISPEMFDSILSKVDLVDNNDNQIFTFKNDQSLPLRADNGQDNPIIYAIQQPDGSYIQIDENHDKIGKPFSPPNDYQANKVEIIAKPSFGINNKGELIINVMRQLF